MFYFYSLFSLFKVLNLLNDLRKQFFNVFYKLSAVVLNITKVMI